MPCILHREFSLSLQVQLACQAIGSLSNLAEGHESSMHNWATNDATRFQGKPDLVPSDKTAVRCRTVINLMQCLGELMETGHLDAAFLTHLHEKF